MIYKKIRPNRILVIGILILATFSIIILFNTQQKNISSHESLSWGQGWENNTSKYSGSELNFILKNSSKIIIEISSKSKADQGIQIFVNEKISILKSKPNGVSTISINLEYQKQNEIKIRYFCTNFYDTCEIKISKINVNRTAKVLPIQNQKKTISILGDSISTNYGYNNFSFLLADKLGYSLHNASVLGSTVSEIKDHDNAINRYANDILPIKSEITIIFIGTNDAQNNSPHEIFKTDYSTIVSDIKISNPETKIIAVGLLPRLDVKPSTLNEYSQIIKTIAENNIYYIDPYNWLDNSDYSDNVHPSLESQNKLADNFKKDILQILK